MLTETKRQDAARQVGENIDKLRELADRWKLPAAVERSISDELDRLQQIAGCVELTGPGHVAARKVIDDGTCSHSDRFAVECEFLIPRVVLDSRGADAGKLAERLESALYDAAMIYLQAADAINCYRQPVALTDHAAGPDAADNPTEG